MPRRKSSSVKTLRTKERSTAAGGKTGITRRDVLKVGAAAGGVAVLTSTKAFRTHFPAAVQAQPPCVLDCKSLGSPAHHPFLQTLTPPPILATTTLNPPAQQSPNINAGEAPRCDHQRWSEFLPQKTYALHAKESSWLFHPDFKRTTNIWAFNDNIPGPTIIAKIGEPGIVRFFNDLDPTDTGIQFIPEITTHMHNGHTASESDGFAGDFFGPGCAEPVSICPPSGPMPTPTSDYCAEGSWKDNHYPNIYAGYDEFGAPGDWREAQYSLWYHDHRAMFTMGNSYKGLAGMYLIFDNRDSGNENDPNGLRLPSGYGIHDFPLVFSDRTFNSDGSQLAFIPGMTGDKWTINGQIQPSLNVAGRKYRFRFLNTGPSRTYQHQFRVEGQTAPLPVTVVATDGNLLEHPIVITNSDPANPEWLHSVAERYDVIVDFSTVAGKNVYLLNLFETDGCQYVGNCSPSPLPPGVEIEEVTARFVVGDVVPDPSRIPDPLTEYPPMQQGTLGTKEWNFQNNGSQFVINGLTFDPNRTDHTILQGNAEIWTIRNKMAMSNWTHPVHIHFEEFRILKRNGVAPGPTSLESGRKDIVRMPPNNEVVIYMAFRDFHGRYLIHCHNMLHEDNFMMVKWEISNS
jgi:FtsP/CotA-like multicopper oxidase with cupredoxin domain